MAVSAWQREYIRKFNQNHSVETRIACYGALVALTLFATWDAIALGWQSEVFASVQMFRYGSNLPLIVLAVWASYYRAETWRIDILMTVFTVSLCLSIVPIYWLYHLRGISLDSDALMLAVTAVYFLPNIFYQQKLITGASAFIAYLMYTVAIDGGLHDYINAVLYFGLINVAGSIHAVSFDAHRKANYQKSQFLKDLAHTDQLTGAENRHKFEERFEALLVKAKEEQTGIGIAIIDIDYFKRFNDFYGHMIGDDCLIRVAKAFLRLREHELDRCVRFGGEEFILIKYGLNKNQVANWGEKIVQQVRQLNIAHEDSPIGKTVTCSAGLIYWDSDRELTRTQLMKAADDALYQAKEQGRDRCVVSGI